MRLMISITTAIAAAALLAACDSGGGDKAAAPAAAPAPAMAAAPAPAMAAAPAPAMAAAAPAAAPSAADAERDKMAKLVAVYADEASFSADCVSQGKLDKGVCDCAAKQTVKTIGAKGLYRWVWEGYVNRDGTAQMRSRKWFDDEKIDTAGKKKFADAVATCYVTSPAKP